MSLRSQTLKADDDIKQISHKQFDAHIKFTCKAAFLARMNKLVPWTQLEALVEPHDPKADNGRPPRDLSTMLRMYCVANWFDMADEACEDALYDVQAFRDYCQVDLATHGVPETSSLLNFRHSLDKHDILAAIFAKAPEAKDFTNKRVYCNTPLTDRDKQIHHTKSLTRAKVEHLVLTLKRIWGFAKVRYRGLAKSANRMFAMQALINIDRWGSHFWHKCA